MNYLEKKFLIYARAIILNHDGQLLMVQKNASQKIAANRWLLPGGQIEFGELPESGLNRELFEEVNYRFEICKLFGTDTRIIQNTHWLGLFYKTEGDIQNVFNKEPEKHNEIRWCDLEFAKIYLSKNEYAFVLEACGLTWMNHSL